MDQNQIEKLLFDLKADKIDITTAVDKLKTLPFEDIGSAKVDHHRKLRCGFSEVIFAQGKTVEQVREIFGKLAAKNQNVLATRANFEMYQAVAKDYPAAEFFELARTITLLQEPVNPIGHIAIVAAGTSDLPVAEEAKITAEILGARVTTHYDCGVAGIHRLFSEADEIQSANVVVAIAGMEGALASVIGGLVSVPVIAVPTSVGYGANFGGLAALLAMLNSCASGISVVNIDNGFAGGYNAALINKLVESR